MFKFGVKNQFNLQVVDSFINTYVLNSLNLDTPPICHVIQQLVLKLLLEHGVFNKNPREVLKTSLNVTRCLGVYFTDFVRSEIYLSSSNQVKECLQNYQQFGMKLIIRTKFREFQHFSKKIKKCETDQHVFKFITKFHSDK